MRNRRTAIVLGVLIGSACSEPTVTGLVDLGEKEASEPSLPGLLVSNISTASASVASGAFNGGVTYVSLLPGSLPQILAVHVRNLDGAADITAVPVIAGGFDPVPVLADEGDRLRLALISVSGTTSFAYARVPARRPPVIVRTFPSKGRTDVALGVIPLIVFNEPVDAATLEGNIQLLGTAGSVDAAIEPQPSAPWAVRVVPATPLEPLTTYQLRVAEGVLDLDGEALDTALTVTFTTGASTTPPPEPPPGPPPAPPSGPPPVAPGDARVAFTSTRNGRVQIFLAKGDGSDVALLTDGSEPHWSPGADSLVFNRGTGIWVIGADGGGVRYVGEGLEPAWSPDGSRILFLGSVPYERDLFVMNTDGSGRTSLLDAAFAVIAPDDTLDWPLRRPAWSPDGSKVAFIAFDDMEFTDVYVMDIPSGKPVAIGNGATSPFSYYKEGVAWSPDGQQIAYESITLPAGTSGPWTYVIASSPLDGSGRSIWYTSPSRVVDPAWSADGRFLAFTNGMEDLNGTRIFIVDVGSPTATQLIGDVAGAAGYGDGQVAWAPRTP